MKKIAIEFYRRSNVVDVARDLLGKVLMTRVDGKVTGGMITETEAYNGIVDRASHAFGGRRTTRTETMYRAGGTSYVYLCYGMYSLFNVVTGKEDVPHAVLIRSIQPLLGVEEMVKRRMRDPGARNFSSGPGTLTQALGIHYRKHNAISLLGKEIWLEEGLPVHSSRIKAGPRIGVDYAGKDAQLPYRFVIENWKADEKKFTAKAQKR